MMMFKAKMLVLATTLLMSGVAVADLNTGLMAYYNFDDCSANDSSANANNGTVKGNLSCVAGVANKALQFDGASYITVPNAASLNPTTQLTMSFWIRVDAFTNTWSGIIHKGGFAGSCYQNREYSLWLNSSSYIEQNSAGDSNCQIAVDSKKVTKGKWLYYVGVVDRVKHIQSIYINGVLNSKKTDSYSTFNINNYDLRIGYPEETGTWHSPFKGALDEIRLYNRALTAAEISSLYYQGIPVTGTIKSLNSHTVTCKNNTTAQSITIPASTATAYDCEAKGLKVNPQDNVTITINGNVQ
jgi:hypothetical protein